MANSFFAPYEQAPYPCYFLQDGGTLLMNAAAGAADAPLCDAAAIEKLLRGAKQEMENAGGRRAKTLPLLTQALRMRTLTLLPVPGGLLAVAVEEREAPVNAFSAEVREPLTNIFATLPLLANQLEDPDRHLAEEVQENCYVLLRLAANLENASRIEKKKFELVPVDLATLVESLCFAADSVSKRQGVPISWVLPSAPLTVCADARLLSEVLMNLLRNSLQYTRDGNHVHIKLASTKTQAIITVEDAGLGIRPENLERIFEPYFSVDPYGDSPQRPGLGLGLSVVREAVQSFGGTVNIESRFGEGTRVVLALPLDRSGGEVLCSASADYLLNRYSPVYIHLCGFCRLPGL